MLGLKAAPADGLINNPTSATASNVSNVATMNLDTTFFETSAGAPSNQGNNPAAAKVLADLPVLSHTLSSIFEQSK